MTGASGSFPGDAAGALGLRMLAESASAAVATYAADGTIIDLTGGLVGVLGLRPEDVRGRNVHDYPQAPDLLAAVDRALAGETVTATFVGRDHEWNVKARPLRDDRDEVVGAVAVFTFSHDSALEGLLARRLEEQRYLTELARLALTKPLDELVRDAIRYVELGAPGTVCGIMQRSEDGEALMVVGTSQPTMAGVRLPVEPWSMSGRAMAEDRTFFSEDVLADDRWPDHGSQVGMRSTFSTPIPGPTGAWGTVGCASPEPRRWPDEDVAFLEGVAATLGAAVRRHELESQLQHQALHDPLTGLPNRALVTDRIDHALRRAGRSGSMVAVLLLDLDDFKTVNDSLGHVSGDTLLTELATRLPLVVRAGDTVARLGGDEFVVVCEDVMSERDAGSIAESLLAACADGIDVSGRRLELSASIGVTLSRSGQASPSTLLSEADIAMYRAKRDRPGTYRIFDEAMRGDVVGRLNLAGELRSAIREDRIDVDFQPIVDLASGRIVAMEALARWTGPDGERVPPDVFIPLAEETGLIGELGTAVLARAASYTGAWQHYGPIGLRVNASAHELRGHRFVDRVLETLRSRQVFPSLLGVEVTESLLLDDDRATQESLTRLRAAGVTLLVDDFGTGYSSLSYLQRFPVVDVLKIDRSFLDAGTSGTALIEAIVALGRAFGAQVCAEGVETQDQLALVRRLGCDLAQGYLLGRPVPADESLAVVADWQPVAVPSGA